MTDNKVDYSLGENGEFIIKNYNKSKPFSGFFPAIAGIYGKPIWAFYVNRAQGICSFGIEGKDGAILEFNPANKAYSVTSTNGFRTFLRIWKDGVLHRYEPFIESANFDVENSMSISSSDLFVEERNRTLGITVSARYFCIPNEPYSAIVRILNIKNEGNNQINVEIIDGLPFVLPFGVTEGLAKSMCHTLQAWMQVVNNNKNTPMYRLKVEVADKPIVTTINKANFYFACQYTQDSKQELLKTIIDPSLVFGKTMDLRNPQQFFRQEDFTITEDQVSEGITPSAFCNLRFDLPQNSNKEIYSILGHGDNDLIVETVKKSAEANYFNKKHEESKKIIQDIQNNMLTESSSYAFNLYCKNTFLDNILRGGYPVTLQKTPKTKILHLYSRRHGDIERDYNNFQIKNSFYSQGDGNFRDVCQNRRNDIWFNPDVDDENIKTFVNLIQLDGYNPLQLKGDAYKINTIPRGLALMKEFFNSPFTIGEMLDFIKRNKINIKLNEEQLVALVISKAEKQTVADFREGYWIDHWTYINDLLDSYKAVFPEKYFSLFLKNGYTFFDSPCIVKPRIQKITLHNGKVRQYNSIYEDKKKLELINKRKENKNFVRTKYGKGAIYKTTLLSKLLVLLANKYANLDAFGVGIEMEADRPGWYDALNGLPGLFGSSTCETFELKRIILIVKEVIQQLQVKKISLPVEFIDFIENLFKGKNKKDVYRRKTAYGVSGKEKFMALSKLEDGLTKMLANLEKGITKAFDKKSGLYHTYYENMLEKIKPLTFKQRPLPLFLEGQVHALRLMPNTELVRSIYNSVRKNGLYDEKIKMYKVNASLANESFEIGRVKVFSPGWLENESIWVHMEYKYLLELLRNGLYEEFFEDFKAALIPFQNPAIFGRSILESCSFIASSAHPNADIHGAGFLPRLTGATVEFIHMWLWMCIGKKPFILNEKNELNLKFSPVLPDWLFNDEGIFGFNLFGDTRVLYHNPKKKNTFGKDAAKPFRILFDTITIEGDTVPAPYAEQIRDKKIKRIDIYMA